MGPGRTPRRAIRIGLCAGALAVMCSAVGATKPSPVGFVYQMTGKSSAYRINRDGKAESITKRFLLFDGDQIAVSEPKDQSGKPAVITLWITGRLYNIGFADSPFCVGQAAPGCKSESAGGVQNPVPKVFWSILESVASIVEEARGDAYSSQVDQMVSRGPSAPPSIPMLPSSPLAIQPQSAPILAFEWLGGQPPFAISVVSPSSHQIVTHESGVLPNSVAFKNLQLAPGTYHVRIVDAAGQKARGDFQCVAQPLPALSIDGVSEDLQLPPDAIATIRAGLLAKQGVEWYLAAYDMLAPFPDDGPGGQVHALRYWLAEGLPAPQ